MSISASYPNLRPTLLLDFANSGRLDPRVTFSRASTATYYDAATSSLAEQNLLVQSQNFATTWFTTNASVATDSTTAPDGTSTADTITDDATSSPHSVAQAVGMAVDVDFTFSCFLQAGTSNYAFISLTDFINPLRYATVVVDLSAGTITDTDNSAGTTASSSITSVGSGWYRVSVTAQRSSTPFAHVRVGVSDSGTPSFNTFGSPTYSGSGSTIYVWGAQLERRSSAIVYTPTTTQPITNYVPTLLTAANNVPRFDYDPVTREARGFLIEEQRTNQILYSEDFGDATWVKTGGRVVVTTNQIAAPDGTVTADFLEANGGASGSRSITQTDTSSATGKSQSVFAKAGTATFLQILFGTDTAPWANFDLSTGTVGSTGTVTSATITPVGNGWYRCQVTTASTTATNATIGIVSSSAAVRNESNTLSAGLYIWGAQMEAGSFPTSYIPTTTTALTRSADVASVNTLSPWYNATEGTIYADFSVSYDAAASTFPLTVSFDDNTTPNRIVATSRTIDDRVAFSVVSGGVSQTSLISANTITYGVAARYAAAYAVGDAAIALNGVLGGLGTPAVIPSGMLYMRLGNAVVGGVSYNSILNGHLRRITYYPRRLSNAELQAITA